MTLTDLFELILEKVGILNRQSTEDALALEELPRFDTVILAGVDIEDKIQFVRELIGHGVKPATEFNNSTSFYMIFLMTILLALDRLTYVIFFLIAFIFSLTFIYHLRDKRSRRGALNALMDYYAKLLRSKAKKTKTPK